MDQIIIKDLECFARHGVLKEENVLGQKFLISLIMDTDTMKAGTTDDLNESINYALVAQSVKEIVENNVYQLIETVAETIARTLLLQYKAIQNIEVTVKKPWAPITMPVDTVAVHITRSWHEAILALGTNMGEKVKNLNRAVELIKENPYCMVTKVSDFITTAPYGVTDQDDFLNGAMVVRTILSPEEILELIGTIEKDLNRVRERHWGSRTIDVDIIFYDDEIIRTDTLIIPHIEMHKRDFVLQPIAQIAPAKVHPVYHKMVVDLYEELKKN